MTCCCCLSKNQFEHFEDTALVLYVQAGNTAWRLADSVLLVRHREALLRRCRARLGNQSDAEDALQETLLRAFRAIKNFKGQAAFKSWLYVIADNQCNTLMSQRARHQTSDHFRALIEIHEQAYKASQQGDHGSEAGVRKVLNEIPEGDREILTLRFYGELSIEDIAHTLGIKLSAAKMRLYRAQEHFEYYYRQFGLAEMS